MKTIAIANQKGGVAKTTTARETAAMLAEAGSTVLMLDLDGQHDLTNFFLEDAPDVSITDVVKGLDVRKAVMQTGRDRLHIIGATEKEYVLDEAVKKDREAIRRALEVIGKHYDYCVIDFPRAASYAAISALAASDAVVIPSEANRASVNNAAKMIDLALQVADSMNPSLKIAGVLLTRYTARKNISSEYESLLSEVTEARGVKVFNARIPSAAAVEESEGYGLTLLEHKPNSKPAIAYKNYLIELLANL